MTHFLARHRPNALLLAVAILTGCSGGDDKPSTVVDDDKPSTVDDDIAKANRELRKGKEFLDKQDYNVAMRCFEEALRLNPESAAAYFHRGLLVAQQDDRENAHLYLKRSRGFPTGDHVDKAIKDFSESIRLDSKSADTYFYRGVAFYERSFDSLNDDVSAAQADATKAIADFTRAVELRNDFGRVYHYRGLCHILMSGEPDDAEAADGLKSLDQAISDFTDAIRIDPKDAQSYGWRSLAYEGRSRADKTMSLNDRKKAMELDSNVEVGFGEGLVDGKPVPPRE